MVTVYIDFDNTIVESNQRVIEILNERYNTSKNESDLLDYNYNSIAPISITEKVQIFEDDYFFEKLQLKDGFLRVFNKYKTKYSFVVVSKGTKINLEKKEKWINDIIPGIKFIGIESLSLKKDSVNMKNAIQIDDCSEALNTNAGIKVLYKSGNNFEWQQSYENKDILVVNTWDEIDDILQFYNEYNYDSLDRK